VAPAPCCGALAQGLFGGATLSVGRAFYGHRVAAASERRSWAVPPMTGVVDDIDLALLDPADRDQRRVLIEAEHPMLRQALEDDLEEVLLDGHLVNPSLHIALHEIVAERLWADDPPETWSTAQRLSALGYDRHEVLHMLMSVLSEELFGAMRAPGSTPQDPGRIRAALAALPGTWDAQRQATPVNRAERRAQQRAHRRRRR
jgi:hypothetical protein